MSLLDTASSFAVRHLGKDRLERVRRTYLSTRKALNPVMRRVYGSFDADALRHHLEDRLDSDFDILMVHSSVNNMLPMYDGNPLQLVRMLIDFCGPARTLVMPTFYFGDPAIGGAGRTFQQKPVFDVRRTPSQMGLATELFRRSKGVLSSRHPIYRVSALGPLAELLTLGHENAATAIGEGTPFDLMTKHNSLIIGIGKPIDVLTQVHHAEALMGEKFPVPRGAKTEPISLTLIDGDEKIPFDLGGGSGLRGRRNMWKLRQIMSRDRLREWRFHHVPIFATYAADVTHDILRAAENGVTIYE